MFCPQCGSESSAELHYCRSCGANLKVIGKAVSLSEAIGRSDGVPAKNKEIVRSSRDPRPPKPWWLNAKRKTAEQRRERHLTKGTIKFFWGGGLSIFLYFLAHALVLKLPPDVLARIPFELDPVVQVIWLLGLIPMLSGVGHILAGLSIRPDPPRLSESVEQKPLRIDSSMDGTQYKSDEDVALRREAPASVTEHTTNILDRDPARQT